MSATASARVIPADSTINVKRPFLIVEHSEERERLTIPTGEPFIPMGCNLDGKRARHEQTAPIILEKITASGRLYANGCEIVRVAVNELIDADAAELRKGWDVLAALGDAVLPTVCVLDGIYKISSLLPNEWNKEKDQTFFLATIYEVKHTDTVHREPTCHVRSLSKENGVMHWHMRCLDFDFSNRYIAIVSPTFDLEEAA